MRTPWDGYGSDDPLQARDPRYPIDVGPGQPKGAARALSRIAVKSVNRIVIVQVTDIVRIEAEDNYVRLWADRPYLHKETLSGLMTRTRSRDVSSRPSIPRRQYRPGPRAPPDAAWRISDHAS